MTTPEEGHTRRKHRIESDFPPGGILTRPGNIVKPRTVSEPPEVPPELLRMNDDEDCPRLASVASVARMRGVSGAGDHAHRLRRRGSTPEKFSMLLTMSSDMQKKGTVVAGGGGGELRRCDSAYALGQSKSSLGLSDSGKNLSPSSLLASKRLGLRPLLPSTKFDVGIADTSGRREEMQDACAVCGNFGGNPENNLFLLLDGHSGKEAADLAAVKLPACLKGELDAGKEPGEALRESFRKTHEMLLEEASHCGTTATALLFVGDRAWVAHVGDSRAITIADDGTTTRLTTDHRPANEDEAAAVRARGGFVVSLGGGNLRVNGVIAITRALGDKALADALTCDPDINEFSFPPGGAVVLACDGLWDVVSDADVARIATDQMLNCRQAAEVLRDLAFKSGSFDNITVMVIRSVR